MTGVFDELETVVIVIVIASAILPRNYASLNGSWRRVWM